MLISFAGTASVSSSLRSCGAFSSCYSRWSRRLYSNQQKALLFKIFK